MRPDTRPDLTEPTRHEPTQARASNSDDAQFWIDRDGYVERWSGSAMHLFGRGERSALGIHLGRLLDHSGGSDFWAKVGPCLDRYGRWEDVAWRRRADGTRFWARCVIDTCRSLDGEPVGWLVVVRKLAVKEDAVGGTADSEALRLQSLGRAAGGVAHDLNNILMAIECFAGLVEEELPEHGKAREIMGQLLGATHRGMRLSRDVLHVGGEGGDRGVDVSECVRHMEPLLRALVPPRIALTLELGSDLPAVAARAADIELVVLNLVANARDAMAGEGRVEIDVKRSPTSPENVVELSVRDSGGGIPDSVREHVFDRYVTTKVAGEGSGLGLSMVLDVVRDAKARLELHSSPEHGTSVDVAFPIEGSGIVAEESVVSGRHRIRLDGTLGAGVSRPLELLLCRRGYDVVVGGETPDAFGPVSLVIGPDRSDGPGEYRHRSRGGDACARASVLRLALVATEDGDGCSLPLPCAPTELIDAVERLLGGEASLRSRAHGIH